MWRSRKRGERPPLKVGEGAGEANVRGGRNNVDRVLAPPKRHQLAEELKINLYGPFDVSCGRSKTWRRSIPLYNIGD